MSETLERARKVAEDLGECVHHEGARNEACPRFVHIIANAILAAQIEALEGIYDEGLRMAPEIDRVTTLRSLRSQLEALK